MKTKTKTKIRTIVRKLDVLWREQVKIRWNNRCAICGKSEGKLDCHHLVSRSVGVLRHDPRNGILLCPLHHVYDSTLSAHKGTLLFFLRLQEHEMVDLKYLTERMMIKKSMTDRVWLEEVSELLSNHTQK